MEKLILIIMLGSSNFTIREQAFKELDKNPPIIHLMAAKEQSNSLEIRRRCDLIIRNYNRKSLDNYLASTKKFPWFIYTVSIDDNTYDIYIKMAREIMGGVQTDWSDYRLATKLFIQENYTTREEAIILIESLWEAERNWITQNGHCMNPPIVFTRN